MSERIASWVKIGKIQPETLQKAYSLYVRLMLCTRIRHSAGTENLVPEEVNYTKIAIRVTVMNKVQFLLAVLMIPRRLIPESSMLSRTQRLALSQAYAPSLENDRILGQGNSARQNDAAC